MTVKGLTKLAPANGYYLNEQKLQISLQRTDLAYYRLVAVITSCNVNTG
jgi:hypothetical protein